MSSGSHRPRSRIVYSFACLVIAAALLGADSRRLTASGFANVSVTPDAGSSTLNANSSATLTFTVANNGAFPDDYDLACARTGQVLTCSVQSMVSVNNGASVQVAVTVSTGAAGTGTVTLTATSQNLINDSDQGDYHVTVQSAPPSSVTVTVASGNPTTIEITTSADIRYIVHNGGTISDTYNLACSTTGPITCVVLGSTSVTLAAGADASVTVRATASTSTGAATLTLTASGPATGSATHNLNVFRPFLLSLAYTNGDRIVRSDCPTVGAGPGSAIQCGDLFFAHALPAYRSMNKSRNVTLLYNSGTARPMPVVALDYTTWPGDAIPTALKVEIRRNSNNTVIATRYFNTAGFSSTVRQVHRLSIPINAGSLGLATGAHSITVNFSRKIGGAYLSPDVISTNLLVVNRRTSPFGAGWWPAGVERLYRSGPYPEAPAALVVLGDGSALYYMEIWGGEPFI